MIGSISRECALVNFSEDFFELENYTFGLPADTVSGLEVHLSLDFIIFWISFNVRIIKYFWDFVHKFNSFAKINR